MVYILAVYPSEPAGSTYSSQMGSKIEKARSQNGSHSQTKPGEDAGKDILSPHTMPLFPDIHRRNPVLQQRDSPLTSPPHQRRYQQAMHLSAYMDRTRVPRK